VVDAIASRSPDAARDAMARHLASSHDRFTANWPGAPASRRVAQRKTA